MQEEYTNDKKLCEWLRANSSGIYRLTGFAADKIEQLKEELETLRASNTIKQANIELLEAENAKLIAERDSEKYELELHRADYKAIKVAGFESPGELLAAYNHYIAEREAMMKPKHKRADELVIGDGIKKNGEFCKIFQITNNGGYIKINFDEPYLPPEALIEMVYGPLPYGPLPAQQKDNCQICKGEKGGVPGNENVIDGKTVCDFCHADGSYKLPAQQIPEGYAKIPEEVSHHDPLHYGETDWCRGYNACISDMLSASQPKGDM